MVANAVAVVAPLDGWVDQLEAIAGNGARHGDRNPAAWSKARRRRPRHSARRTRSDRRASPGRPPRLRPPRRGPIAPVRPPAQPTRRRSARWRGVDPSPEEHDDHRQADCCRCQQRQPERVGRPGVSAQPTSHGVISSIGTADVTDSELVVPRRIPGASPATVTVTTPPVEPTDTTTLRRSVSASRIAVADA